MLGDKLRTARKLRGYTQTDVANYLNVSFQQIGKFENGSNRISAPQLLQFCELVDISPNEILGYKCNIEKKKKKNETNYL